MKLQYVWWSDGDHYTINTYHDGKLINHYENIHFIEGSCLLTDLRNQGYEVAFLPEDVESAKQEYEYMLAHVLMTRER